jgi:hypothetical protein
MSPLLAQSGHADTLIECPLLGVKRTFHYLREYALSAVLPPHKQHTLGSSASKAFLLSRFTKKDDTAFRNIPWTIGNCAGFPRRDLSDLKSER